MDHIDCIVVGAGVVGLAAARALAVSGREVLVLEAASLIGSETSSRNSEVIHAGIYYEPGSAKALHCVEGRRKLYRYAADRGVPHRACGKLIVATDPSQVRKLETIVERAALCGVEDLTLIDGPAARRLEPAVSAEAAVLSPSTGIIDSHAYMLALVADLEAAGSSLVLNTRVEAVRRGGGGLLVVTRERNADDVFVLSTSLLVNAAGLGAQRLAESVEGLPPERIPKLHLAKGNYFSASGRSPFSRLIYPVPVEGGLGVHLTFDLSGQMRFGPDVEWIDGIDYAVDPDRARSFYREIRRYWPGLAEGALAPAYSGIRPKLCGAQGGNSDFVVEGPQAHGIDGLVNVFGVESPGLTASLSLADAIRDAAAA